MLASCTLFLSLTFESAPKASAAVATSLSAMMMLGSAFQGKNSSFSHSKYPKRAEQCRFSTLLLNYGARVDAQDKKGWSPLFTGWFWKQNRVMRLFVEHGADVNHRDEKKVRTLLHYAAARNREESVRYLLQNGADSCIQDIDGKCPLELACQQGSLDAIFLLFKYGIGDGSFLKC